MRRAAYRDRLGIVEPIGWNTRDTLSAKRAAPADGTRQADH
jgi:hypothetical protein